MHSVKNLSHNKNLDGNLIDNFLDFVTKELDLDQPFSVYFVDDKKNAKDALGKTAMYNPGTKSVYVYATDRHPKDILRSVAHELMHHKQHCDGHLEDMSLEDAEMQANETGYLLRKYEDGLKQKLDEALPFIGLGVAMLGALLLRGDSDIEKLKNKAMKRIFARKDLSLKEKEKLMKQVRGLDRPKEDLESIVEAIDIIGIIPGIGDFLDLANIAPKLILAYGYHNKPDKIKIPFTDVGIKMSTFYIIDAAISGLSAVEVGEPAKIVKLLFQRGMRSATEAIMFSESMIKFIDIAKRYKLDLFIAKTGLGTQQAIDDAVKVLKGVAVKAKTFSKNIKAVRAVERTLMKLRDANPLQVYDIFYGGKGKLFPKMDSSMHTKFIDLINNNLKKRSAAAMKSPENLKSFNTFFKEIPDVPKQFLDDIADLNLTNDQKGLIGFLLRNVDTRMTNFKIIDDDILSPIITSIKSGSPAFLKNIEQLKIPELPPQLTKIELDFSKPLEAASGWAQQVFVSNIDRKALMTSLEEIVGKQIQKDVLGELKKIENIKTKLDAGKMDELSKGLSQNPNHFNDEILKIKSSIDDLADPNKSSELLNQMNKAIDDNFKRTGTLGFGAAQSVAARAKRIKAAVNLGGAVARWLGKFVDRNFLGKGYISGAYITPTGAKVGAKVVNFVTWVMPFLTTRTIEMAKGNLTQKVVSILIASSYFGWLRVMSFEQYYPGGGGKKGKKPSLRPDKKELRKKAPEFVEAVLNPTELEPVVKAVEAIEKAAENNTALNLPGEATATIEKELKKAANKAQNPLTKKLFNDTREAFVKAQESPKAATDAAVDLGKAVTETTGVIEAERKKVVSASPNKNRLPKGEQKKAEGNTNTMGSQIGDPSSGEGGGVGGGKGTGEGEGEGAGSGGKVTYSYKQFVKNYKERDGFGDQTKAIIDGIRDLVKDYKRKGDTELGQRRRGVALDQILAAGLFPGAKGEKTAAEILDFIEKNKNEKKYTFQESKDVSLNDVLREYREKELNDKFIKLIKGMTE